jgi:hypothetical protein
METKEDKLMELNKKRNGFLRTSIREVDEANLTITHTINTKALDRYSTIVLPKGADVKHFLNNAVVLWSHNMDEATPKIPIGRCVDLDIREDEIVTTTEFNKNDPLAVKVFNAYKDGFLHAWSIGFMPLKYKRYDEENMEDLNKKYGLSVTREQIDDADFWGVYLIYKWELLEYSAVPVPGNPEALSADGAEKYKRELVTRGLVDEKSAKEMDVREMLRRDEEEEKPEEDQTEEEATEENEEPKEDKPEGEEVPDSNKSEEEAEEEEEAPAEEESTEETESEEEETPEEDEESEEETESSEEESEEAPEETEEESEEEESEEEDPEEEAEDEAEAEEAEEESDESETVAKETDKETEEEQKPDDKKALETKVDELTQRNQELSERLAKMEEKINEMSRVSKILDEIKETLDVDNIDKVRDAAQKRKGHNPDTWFSNYLRGNR